MPRKETIEQYYDRILSRRFCGLNPNNVYEQDKMIFPRKRRKRTKEAKRCLKAQ